MHYAFPYNFVYWEKVVNHQEIKEKYYNNIILKNKNNIQKKNEWIGDLKTSYNNNDLNKCLYENYFTSNVIWPYFDNMLVELCNNIPLPIESYISEIWYNVYEKGNFQEPHQHDRNYRNVSDKVHVNSYCGIYLLHLEEKNTTVFYEEPPIPCSIDNSGINFLTDFMEEGNVILFPSGLSHYVLPSKTDRCTISFNITSVFENVFAKNDS